MNNVNDAIELDAAPIKVRQPTDRRVAGELSSAMPPAHVAALLQAEGMNYDRATFAAMTLEQHAEEGFKGLRVSVLAAVYSGCHLVQARELSKRLENPNKHFIREEAERRGVSIHSLYNMIDVYEFFCRSPEECVKPFAHMDFYKLVELKKFSNDELEQLADGGEVKGITLEAAKTMSVRDIKAAFKEDAINTKAYRDLQKKMEDARKVIQHKDQQLAQANTLFAHTGQPPIVADMRVKSTAITGQIHILLDMLADMEVTLAKGYESGLAFEKDERTQQLRAALMPWTINLNATQARIAQIINRAQDHFDSALFPGKDDLVQLSETECLAVKTQHAFMTDLMDKVGQKQQGKSMANNKKKGKKK
ncbi:MAG: hypothetical protein QX197_14205 [Methylococcaceae bacterium]